MKFLLPTICLLAADASEILLDRPVPVLQTDLRFRQELERPISAAWSGAELRGVLRRLSEDRQVAILLDRGLDPQQEITLDVGNLTLRQTFDEIAGRAGAAVSVAGHVVYIGPEVRAAKLRTLIELRAGEIFQSSRLKNRQLELSARRTIHWNDLDSPTDVLRQIGEKFKLEIANLDAIPHDLWAGATLPNVTAYESLSLVLIQFDQTFEWNEKADGVRIVPIPEQVALRKTYAPRGRSPQDVLRRWQELVPDLQAEIQGREIVVTATVEQHETLADSLRPTSRRPAKPTTAPVPLRRREFTLRIERVPVSAVMKKLEQSDVVFKYDPVQLTAAGIDLNEPISMDANKATAEEFFRLLFEPLGLEFQIENLTVRLRPK